MNSCNIMNVNSKACMLMNKSLVLCRTIAWGTMSSGDNVAEDNVAVDNVAGDIVVGGLCRDPSQAAV